MFERVDIERVFGEDGDMARTGVRRRVVRRQISAFVIAVSLAAAITGPVAHAAASKGRGSRVPAGHAYVVASGDTLWSIASDASPGSDPRPLVAAIERANHLVAPDLTPGQSLIIPSSS
jgi:Tfp pilus assembly protein FimV